MPRKMTERRKAKAVVHKLMAGVKKNIRKAHLDIRTGNASIPSREEAVKRYMGGRT